MPGKYHSDFFDNNKGLNTAEVGIGGDFEIGSPLSKVPSPVSLDMKQVLNLQGDVDNIKGMDVPEELKMESWNRINTKMDELFVDADTLRGDTLGLDRNIRAGRFDALEDKTKGMSLVDAIKGNVKDDLGRIATKVAKDSMISTLFDDEQTPVLNLRGESDFRNDNGKRREVGDLFTLDKQGKADTPIENNLYSIGAAVPFIKDNEPVEDRLAKRKLKEQIVMESYKDAISLSATTDDKNRFIELQKKSGISDEDIAKNTSSGFARNPVDLAFDAANAINQSFARMGQAALQFNAYGVESIFGKDSPEAKMANSYIKDVETIVDGYEKAINGGANPYNIPAGLKSYYNIKEGKDWEMGSLARESAKSLFGSAPEILMSSKVATGAIFALTKAAEIAEEHNKDATFADMMKYIPTALAYTALNRVELGVLTNAFSRFGQGLKGVTGKAGAIGLAGGSESLVEMTQTYLEEMDLPKGKFKPTAKNIDTIVEAGIQGSVMAGGPSAVVNAPGIVKDTYDAVAKPREFVNSNVKKAAKAADQWFNKKVTTAQAIKEVDDNIDAEVAKIDPKTTGINIDEEGFATPGTDTFVTDDGEVDVLNVKSGESYKQYLQDSIKRKEEVLNREGLKPETVENLNTEIKEMKTALLEFSANPVEFVNKSFMNGFLDTQRKIAKSGKNNVNIVLNTLDKVLRQNKVT